MSGYHYTIEVCCDVPEGVIDELVRRFGNTVTPSPGNGAVVMVDDVDQSGLRALVVFLWDAGLEVLSVNRSRGQPRNPGE